MDFQTKQALRARRFQIADLFILVLAISTAAHLPAQDGVAQAKRPYTISKETTYFTGPLKPDGTIDFIAAVNKHFSQGVTPDNNAARIIVPLLDLNQWATVDQRNNLLSALGLDPAQHTETKQFIDPKTIEKKHSPNLEQFENEHRTAAERLWGDEEFPSVSEWLEDNQDVLAQISAAATMDKYFVPMIADEETDFLFAASDYDAQGVRSVAQAFAIRANNHLAKGQWKDAWADILTIKKLGHLFGQGRTFLHVLVGVAVTGSDCDAAARFIEAAEAKAVDWQTLGDSWKASEDSNSCDGIVSERGGVLQIVCKFSDQPEECEKGFLVLMTPNGLADKMAYKLIFSTLTQMHNDGEVEFDEALRYCNATFDRMIASARIANCKDRNNAISKFEQQFGNWSPFSSSPKSPSHQFATVFLALFVPALPSAYRAEWRTQGSEYVVKLALAARLLQSHTGELPGSLTKLEPLVEQGTMVQPLTGDPIGFHSSEKDILIYHWGSNRVDDGGQIDPARSLDWGIRIAK